MAEDPMYRLTEAAHMAPVPGGRVQYLNEGETVTYLGVPGYHMEPVNEAARKAMQKHYPDGAESPERKLFRTITAKKFDPAPQPLDQ